MDKNLWIKRSLGDYLYEQIAAAQGQVLICLIEGGPGLGKTYLARDLGTRLGSPTGYETGARDHFRWSGILDLYDPDANTDRGIAHRVIEAFEGERRYFDAYRTEYAEYRKIRDQGGSDRSLEEQRGKVFKAFLSGLSGVAETTVPVLAFDTIERLDGARDPIQLTPTLDFFDDQGTVMDWLIAFFARLTSGVVLLFGRPAPHFRSRLEAMITTENAERARNGQTPIRWVKRELAVLTAEEQAAFFANRTERHLALSGLLSKPLRAALAARTGGSPLLLDLALQALLETRDAERLKAALQEPGDGLENVQRDLLNAYMNSLDTNRQIVLRYLALCRNGVFLELLRALEPQRGDGLVATLEELRSGGIPFIKFRMVSVVDPETLKPTPRATYFLHDAMYDVCDRYLLRPEQVRRDSGVILEWYKARLQRANDVEQQLPPEKRSRPPAPDLLVESLLYRLRSDPRDGYEWYLKQADYFIRDNQVSVDMRLHDTVSLFVESARPDADPDGGVSLHSPIDQALVAQSWPELFDVYRYDSAMLWIKRYNIRTGEGKLKLAVQIGDVMAPKVRDAWEGDPERYGLLRAEFLLWYAQSVMYASDAPRDAWGLYRDAQHALDQRYPERRLSDPQSGLSAFDRWRGELIRGRLYNNMGYMSWMYEGQYQKAIRYFTQAWHYFRGLGTLPEELANSRDNEGRVHALLGHETPALRAVDDALRRRRELGLTYRGALSCNSRAQVLLRAGEYSEARKWADQALHAFEAQRAVRGVGLSLLSRGAIYRNWADDSNRYPEGYRLKLMPGKALQYNDRAECDLLQAVDVFTRMHSEQIRLVQATNELGCCYRSRYQQQLALGEAQERTAETFHLAEENLTRATQLAASYQLPIEALDSQQDLAVLYYRSGPDGYAAARALLSDIRAKIATNFARHQIEAGKGLPNLNDDERFDAVYKLMGQVELLEGTIAFEPHRAEAGCAALSEAAKAGLLAAIQHFMFATIYFNRYSLEGYAKRLTHDRIRERVEACEDLIYEVKLTYLREWQKEFGLTEDNVSGFRGMAAL